MANPGMRKVGEVDQFEDKGKITPEPSLTRDPPSNNSQTQHIDFGSRLEQTNAKKIALDQHGLDIDTSKELLLIWLEEIMIWWLCTGKKCPHQLRPLLIY